MDGYARWIVWLMSNKHAETTNNLFCFKTNSVQTLQFVLSVWVCEHVSMLSISNSSGVFPLLAPLTLMTDRLKHCWCQVSTIKPWAVSLQTFHFPWGVLNGVCVWVLTYVGGGDWQVNHLPPEMRMLINQDYIFIVIHNDVSTENKTQTGQTLMRSDQRILPVQRH